MCVNNARFIYKRLHTYLLIKLGYNEASLGNILTSKTSILLELINIGT